MSIREIDGIEYTVYTEEVLNPLLIKKLSDIQVLSGSKRKINKPIDIHKAVFPFKLYLDKVEAHIIEFCDCIFEDDVILTNWIVDKVRFYDCKFHKSTVLLECTIDDFMEFNGGEFKGDFILKGGIYNSIDIVQTAGRIFVDSGKFEDLYIHTNIDTELKHLSIDRILLDLSKIEGRVLIEDIVVTNLVLTGNLNNKTEISLQSVICSDFEVTDITNTGKLRIFELRLVDTDKKPSSVFFKNSNFGKAEFFDCDFTHTENILIKNCFFAETLFAKVLWPNVLQLEERQDDPANLLDLKETYRQLKYSYSKQGDSVLEHKFHGLEMDTYRRYLRENRKIRTGISRFQRWKIDRQTSIILWFSSWSSDYGQSFKLPLITLLGAGILLFPFTVLTGCFKELQPGFHPDLSWNAISATIGHFLNFLNPLRRYESMNIGWGIIFDLIMRIIASYCIYNFVRATRRFVK